MFIQLKSKLLHSSPFLLTGKQGNSPKQIHPMCFRFHPCMTAGELRLARTPPTVTTPGWTVLTHLTVSSQGEKGRYKSILWINAAATPSWQKKFHSLQLHNSFKLLLFLELTVAICLGWLEEQSLLINWGLLLLLSQSRFCCGYHPAELTRYWWNYHPCRLKEV